MKKMDGIKKHQKSNKRDINRWESILTIFKHDKSFIIQREEIETLLSRTKKLESELRKWTASHSEENLQDAKVQSEQPSLAAKQVYINGLEKRVKELEDELSRGSKKTSVFWTRDWG